MGVVLRRNVQNGLCGYSFMHSSVGGHCTAVHRCFVPLQTRRTGASRSWRRCAPWHEPQLGRRGGEQAEPKACVGYWTAALHA